MLCEGQDTPPAALAGAGKSAVEGKDQGSAPNIKQEEGAAEYVPPLAGLLPVSCVHNSFYADEALLGAETALPSSRFPSDHLPLVASFQVPLTPNL